MKRLLVILIAMLFSLSLTTNVSANAYEDYFYDYPNYDYTTTLTPTEAATATGVLALFSGVWLVFWCVFMLVAIAVYIFMALQMGKIYEKNGLKDKKVMAFIPLANLYYLAIAVGEEKDAALYALSPLFSIIPCLGIFITLYFGVMLWMKTAKRMGKEEWYGIVLLLSGFVPLIGIFIGAYIVYLIAEGTPVKS